MKKAFLQAGISPNSGHTAGRREICLKSDIFQQTWQTTAAITSWYHSQQPQDYSKLQWGCGRGIQRNLNPLQQHKTFFAPTHLLLFWNWKLLTELLYWAKRKHEDEIKAKEQKNKSFCSKSSHSERGNLHLVNRTNRRWCQIWIWIFQ